MANKSFRANLELDTQLNITDVLTKINKLKKTLISKGMGRSAFAGIEKSLAYVESVMTRLNKYEMSGFANLGEIEKYNNLVQQVEISLNGVISSLSTLAGSSVDINTKNFDNSLERIKAGFDQLQKNITDFFNELKNAQLTIDEKSALKKAIEAGNLEEAKKLYQAILKIRQEQAQADAQALKTKEEELRVAKQQIAVEEAVQKIATQRRYKASDAKNSTYAYKTKGAELVGVGATEQKKFGGTFYARPAKYSAEDVDRWAWFRGYEDASGGTASESTRKHRGEVKNSSGAWIKINKGITEEGYRKIQETYLEVIQKMLKSWATAPADSKTAFNVEDIIKQINEKLKSAFNYTLDASDKLKRYIEEDWRSLVGSVPYYENKVKFSKDDERVVSRAAAQKVAEASSKEASALSSGGYTLEELTKQSSSLIKANAEAISKRDAAMQQAKADEAVMRKEIEETSKILKKNTTAQYENTKSLYSLGEEQLSIGQEFENVRSYVQSLLSVTAIFHEVISLIKTTWNEAKNLDDAFASIAMVSDYSVQEMWSIYDQYNQMAQELGQSTESVVKSSALFIQQGEYVPEHQVNN